MTLGCTRTHHTMFRTHVWNIASLNIVWCAFPVVPDSFIFFTLNSSLFSGCSVGLYLTFYLLLLFLIFTFGFSCS